MSTELIFIWVCGVLFALGFCGVPTLSYEKRIAAMVICLVAWPFMVGLVWSDK